MENIQYYLKNFPSYLEDHPVNLDRLPDYKEFIKAHNLDLIFQEKIAEETKWNELAKEAGIRVYVFEPTTRTEREYSKPSVDLLIFDSGCTPVIKLTYTGIPASLSC